jgi:hypothetical protein
MNTNMPDSYEKYLVRESTPPTLEEIFDQVREGQMSKEAFLSEMQRLMDHERHEGVLSCE